MKERGKKLAAKPKARPSGTGLVPAAVASPPRKIAQVIKAEKASKGGLSLTLNLDKEAAYAAALGSTSADFQSYALTQLVNILLVARGDITDWTLDTNAALAMLSAIAPRDEMEAMLAAQMVATHHLGMREMVRHGYASGLPQCEAHGNMANKFLRTFTTQMEALGKLRRGGEQVVRHVHVNDGGQAVIAGTVNTGGGR